MKKQRKPVKLMSKGGSVAMMIACAAIIIAAVALMFYLNTK